MTFSVETQQQTCGVEMGVVSNAGKNVENIAAPRRCILNAIGGDQRQTFGLRQLNQTIGNQLFIGNAVALEFDKDLLR